MKTAARSYICTQLVLSPSPILRQKTTPECGFPVIFEVFTQEGQYLGGACTNQTHVKRIQAMSSEPTVIRPRRDA